MPGNGARRLIRMFHLISAVIEREKDRLSELDGAIGDADHGITMSIGFLAVNGALARLDLDRTMPADVLSVAATAFLNAVGASTGPLYATAFKRAAQALADREEETLGLAGQAAMLGAIASGIRDRGKGERGDKTMLDVWIPAAEAAADAAARGDPEAAAWAKILQTAQAGADATRTMVATRGRAARVGPRSLGHMDPGAASAVCILGAMRDAFCEG
ncbi:dihydroxyacetone kinase subunit DhaL [Kumtagia ephedrae]|uniref:Dihydroxyacetone kinase subunit L n=1 Tax=Kumtagia ephedrae TaxID=2116701 RepID=A0A2P7SJN6_9HYPH|nr:dihydroxyacetone kinase subunit DhaL [Mesorhizobium ephedrae]PSJ62694.1 dihydroxyacetone kinase subunit L [Mesorhizobium ephedrae]